MNQQLTTVPEPVLDQEIIASLLELGDAAFLAELFEQYVEQAGHLIAEAAEAAAAQDVDSWVGAMHGLAGSSRNVGASRLAAACTAAEIEGRTHGRITALAPVHAEYDALTLEIAIVVHSVA
jgi:HPt (histidine-containing phosphotransfer) domain-containing protein